MRVNAPNGGNHQSFGYNKKRGYRRVSRTSGAVAAESRSVKPERSQPSGRFPWLETGVLVANPAVPVAIFEENGLLEELFAGDDAGELFG